MAVCNQQKKPKANICPTGNTVRRKQNPDSYLTLTPTWQFNLCDAYHQDWGLNHTSFDELKKLFCDILISFSTMTWMQILQASGGRNHGTNNHHLLVSKFTKNAQDRLAELSIMDDTLFSLRCTNTLRIYGVREGRVLKIIWRDPYHGTKRGAYPTDSSQ